MTFYDKHYFKTMKQSQFTLCPRGDSPWSMRFFECILSKSIPILETPSHAGRNFFERRIGYKYFLLSDKHEYREDWVEENFEKFIAHQTLIGASYLNRVLKFL